MNRSTNNRQSRAGTRTRGTQFRSRYCHLCRRETIGQRLCRWIGCAVWRIVVFGLKFVLSIFVIVYMALMLENFYERTGGPGATRFWWLKCFDSALAELSAWLLDRMGRPKREAPAAAAAAYPLGTYLPQLWYH